ncbi:hypothetical protein [Streptomyces collinus]|uniref:hypothetical protein n=1 Tax=Streptomyces collinus TaxID=42684 RepID=UPI0029420944|nr:hypothetical protein [Streptomyces collinus]
MTAQRDPESGQPVRPVPRDLPDQQARPGGDPWDAATRPTPRAEPATDEDDTDVPDTDEAGSGPRDAPPSPTDEPTPEEPTA